MENDQKKVGNKEFNVLSFEMMEEFYNKSHQQSGPQGGQFVEGPDGPGRKRDPGTEDLGKKGTVQDPADQKKRYGGISDNERAARVKENQKIAEINRVKEIAETEKSSVHADSDDIKTEGNDYGGLRGKIKKKRDVRKFEDDIKGFESQIEDEQNNIKQDQSGMNTPKYKINIEKYQKRLAEVKERYEKWRQATGG